MGQSLWNGVKAIRKVVVDERAFAIFKLVERGSLLKLAPQIGELVVAPYLLDSKVYVTSSDPKAADNIAKAPVFVPAAEADAKEAQLRKEADDARKAAEADHKAVATAAETFKASYPGMLHFDYTWDQKKGGALGIEQIWRDDKFTYLRGKFQETPALYELKDGKGSLINYDFANGLYTIPKTVAQGYLSIGKQRVDFRQTKAGS